MQDFYVTLLARLSTGITMAVQVTGVLQGADQATMSYASDIMRGELHALLHGKGEYGEALQGVDVGTVSEIDAISLLARISHE